ncbi:acid protease [Xylariaceae sp. FL1651]|nr:acid protease [Xylariaceae sp. FL1651]
MLLFASPSGSMIWRVVAVLGILVTLADATPLKNNATHAAGATGMNVTTFFKSPGNILSVPLRRFDHRGVATPSIAKRFFKTDVLGVFGAAYLAELTVGTSTNGNPQVVDVLIDTGSFELWVNPNCATSNVPEFCEAFGHYDPSLSSTSKMLSGDGFDITYGSGGASGPYYKDDVYISGAKVEAQQFGVANTSDLVWFGIMGLAHGLGNGFIQYPLIIDSLAAQGFTSTKLFSMDLGGQVDPGATITGEMVFGGVDTNKYSGMLQKVPTDPSDPHYKITLNTLSHRAPGSSVSAPFLDSNLPLAVVVDSGTTLSLLPESVVNQLAAQFPGAESDGNGGYRVDCAFQNQDGSVDFNFLAGSGSVTINVAYHDFIWNSGGDCFLGAFFSDDLGVWILGDTFLRGAYVTFDQTNDALFMANYVSCNGGKSNLTPVPAGPDAAANIPGACPAAAFVNPPASSVLASSATLPAGPVSSTVIPPIASSLGPSLNPVKPAESTTTTTTTTTAPSSSSSPPSTNPGDASSMTPTTVPLNSPTDIPPGAPAQGDPDPPDGVNRVAGADQTAAITDAARIPGVGGSGLEPTTTVTTTITRTVVYTVTACPDSVPDCPLLGQVATRFETTVTTFCPEHDGTPGEFGATAFMESSAPAATQAVVVEQGEVFSGAGESGDQDEAGEENFATIVTQRPTTTIYEITSCGVAAAGDDTCSIGMTTTRVATVLETVRVQPVASASAPPRITPGYQFAPGGFGNGSGSLTACGSACRGVNVVGATPLPTTTLGVEGQAMVAGAAPVDDGKIDRRYLGAALALIWGGMVLL